ncbi:1-carboxy-3-chloro-3,4-dihydroxycyclo hexa-1,5-diene dehydrogenase [Devosia limi DSM 17137]|uniref:1-carboxy-3-chloro-3,4-dihydroxycyclo hexa-1,5-diene dehydrogenase n=1 Tax=Devosia limi DSM 17137 TaxID=1121477 RepID=A0A0F5LXW7_9HYPH|nr:Gfo/Idh/MocA family oxidoreductase [Devosia limi]KKB86502.1 1-carboxy-3-chloro-3,4-dihydroxycyclo hexa-1,5-diene dehydrogenase [Devosia limi DSM 17137]SHE86356.1 Predicted dehydrogenase [Devosia limi DSM 17137]
MTGIGIIGAGHFGAVHARALGGLPGATLVAACRNDADGIAAFVAEHGGTPYTDWRALLDDPAVDAVVIATPHHLHRDVTLAALAAGKHVLLEKPMASTLAECDTIIAGAAHSAAKLMIGHVTRYFLPMQAATDFLATGVIGRPITGTSAFIKLWMESNRQPWHLQKSAGGGMLMTAGIHALDRLVYLMGGQVAAVSAMMGAAFHQQEADDIALINLRFADGRFGHVGSIGYRNGAVTSALQLVCENGVLDIDLNGRLRVGQDGAWRELDIAAEADPMIGAVRRQWQAFLASVSAGTPVPIDSAYARQLVAIIEASALAEQDRREITIHKDLT